TAKAPRRKGNREGCLIGHRDTEPQRKIGHEFPGAAEPQPKRISPQRRRERGGSVPGSARFQLPACLGYPTPSTQDACAPRSPAEENPWQLAKDFRVSSTDEHRSVFMGVHLWLQAKDLRALFLSLTAR